ncbi:hypothetical protein [Streptomyces mirabilis]|uniref:hypothetical protein n=1 Tax=Streptomyces mirabilis TaxID=68239 RepID=UPI0033BE1B79
MPDPAPVDPYRDAELWQLLAVTTDTDRGEPPPGPRLPAGTARHRHPDPEQPMTTPPDPWPLPQRGPLMPMNGTATCHTKDHESAPVCGRPATWHIAWTLEPGVASSFACDVHMDAIRAEYVYTDRHPVGAACPLPGMTWWGLHGRCALDLDTSHDHTPREITHGRH